MARSRAIDYDTQRDRILANAVEAFSRIGYPSASMAQLARSCGTSKATLYHYFENKEALLFEALDRHTAGLLVLVEQAAEMLHKNIWEFHIDIAIFRCQEFTRKRRCDVDAHLPAVLLNRLCKQ